MRAVRLILNQQRASYKKEEVVENEMTYPLPPYSTVIGAIHDACRFKEYHDMSVSVQGDYNEMRMEIKRKWVWFNNRLDDRGTLCKMMTPDTISNAHREIAKANIRNASFKNNHGIIVKDQKMLDEYVQAIREKDKGKLQYYRVKESVQKQVEVLKNIKLVIHVHSDEETMQEIVKNSLAIKALGRSDDMIELEQAEIVTLEQERHIENMKYHAYIPTDQVGNITIDENDVLGGTVFWLNKNYMIRNKKREFLKVKALYVSGYKVKRFSERTWEDGQYVVCFA